jgi:hypothetical protein
MDCSRLAAVACALLLAAPAAAWAGAPNYDCYVTGGGRVTIDQWSGVLATSGFGHQDARWGLMGAIDQNGPTLDATAALRGAPVKVAVRGWGSSVRVTRHAVVVAGRCLFIPGNDVLRRADAGGSALRVLPSAAAARILRIPVGSPVWQDPLRRPRGRWLPVRTVVTSLGGITTVDGWLRQSRPPITRDVAGSPDF